MLRAASVKAVKVARTTRLINLEIQYDSLEPVVNNLDVY